jgi:DNA-binding CsgD family transcriptional regulator
MAATRAGSPHATARELLAIQHVIDKERHTGFADLQLGLVEYASRVQHLRTAMEVLDELHAITTRSLPLSVLAAARFPLKSADWESIHPGKSLFIHKDSPPGWWEDYHAVAQGRFRPALYLAWTSLASYTWTEVRRILEPIGTEQAIYEIALKHGMRDGLTCPVGGRWVVTFWSRRTLCNVLTQPIRVMLVAAANFAALRLEQLAGPDPERVGSRARLTARELSVLRLVSMGARSHDVARELGLGDETVRSHLKKAQAKLDARSRTHAVAEALRQNLIP